jgi:pantoate--beta-alanine ligase
MTADPATGDPATGDPPTGDPAAGTPVPILARTRKGIAAARAALPAPVVLVPTMGALHPGHRSLLRLAGEIAGAGGSVVVSIFVNPLQFGPLEDFDTYPRPLDQDLALCAQEGVKVVFAPGRSEMYAADPTVTVNPGELGRRLEGKFRPGFFDGVLTVVLKLFQLTRPDVAVFGDKDAQQLALIRRMVTDLDLGVAIVGAPLHRDPDGLATSSRNAYLSAAERTSALALSRALAAARAAAAGGAGATLGAARDVLAAAAVIDPPVTLDYLVLAEPAGLTEVGPGYGGPAVLLVAARVGTTRLIDNAPVNVGAAQDPLPGLDAPPAGRGVGGAAPATGGPATGGPATGGPATGGPATGTSATGGPATGTSAPGSPATGARGTGGAA